MPISACDGCTEAHWAEVKQILMDSVLDAGFDGELVSAADDVGIIHKRIIENLYANPIVVCDVSGKNPNVMFELGVRLAFDKPTIIVKDDKTSYSFDTGGIEHLVYPRDLRFSAIVGFKKQLAEKVRATHHRATTDKSYTTFLKHFGTFTVAKLDTKEVSRDEFVANQIQELREMMGAMLARQREYSPPPFRHHPDSPARRPISVDELVPFVVEATMQEFGDFAALKNNSQHERVMIRVIENLKVLGIAVNPKRISEAIKIVCDEGSGKL